MESLTRSGVRSLPEPHPNGAAGAFPLPAPAGIVGVGAYAPARVLTNAELERIVETSDEWITSRTGIRERRIAAPHERTVDLAAAAGARALADARLLPAELDLIIVATVSADQPFPAVASMVQHRLGARRAAAFDLGAACAGFIYALAVAAQFVHTGMYRHVLVIGAETLSRITNWRDRSTCVLFGDGAGAAVVGAAAPGSGFLAFDLGSDGGGGELLAVEPGGWGHPLVTGSDAPQAQSIRMAGSEVFKFAVRVLEESTLRVLAAAGWQVNELDLLVPHQANTRIIDAAARRLGLPPERVFVNVERYGNTSAASVPLALAEAREGGVLEPGARVVLSGFGAGLAWASCALTWIGPRAPEAGGGSEGAPC